VHKGTPALELYEAIRLVARGERVRPPLSGELLNDASARLRPDDLPVLGMALDDTPSAKIAAALRLEPAELDARVDRMLAAPRVEVPASAG
jgi:hypothetical protein